MQLNSLSSLTCSFPRSSSVPSSALSSISHCCILRSIDFFIESTWEIKRDFLSSKIVIFDLISATSFWREVILSLIKAVVWVTVSTLDNNEFSSSHIIWNISTLRLSSVSFLCSSNKCCLLDCRGGVVNVAFKLGGQLITGPLNNETPPLLSSPFSSPNVDTDWPVRGGEDRINADGDKFLNSFNFISWIFTSAQSSVTVSRKRALSLLGS